MSRKITPFNHSTKTWPKLVVKCFMFRDLFETILFEKKCSDSNKRTFWLRKYLFSLIGWAKTFKNNFKSFPVNVLCEGGVLLMKKTLNLQNISLNGMNSCARIYIHLWHNKIKHNKVFDSFRPFSKTLFPYLLKFVIVLILC